jgi:hypothetical protein
MKKADTYYGMIALMGIFILTGCEKSEDDMSRQQI